MVKPYVVMYTAVHILRHPAVGPHPSAPHQMALI
jgi:hypothetical protein